MTDRAWREVGERVFARRYTFLDQQIGAILTDDGPVIVDSRSTDAHGREIVADLREVTALPVAAVVNTHHHWDHTFGNAVFRPAPIWGHVRCAARLREQGEQMRQRVIGEYPDLADDLDAVVLDPPDRTFGDEGAEMELGSRTIALRYLGRGHTDNDIVVVVPDAGVLFAGDLLENGATPYFGDGYPLDWPATVEAIARFAVEAFVPGHGDVVGSAFVGRSIDELRTVADLSRRVHAGEIGLEEACRRSPYPAVDSREPIERALAQLRGELA
jgi:glyoxylase-like metal-dependent hydrolase (beta-lactamase superfamily II)